MSESSFHKSERLCSETAISMLYSKGSKKHAYPILSVWRKRDDDKPARIVISVAKKRFHHAVDRNRVKRLIRAAYRNNKFMDGYDVALIYISSQIEEFYKIENSIKKLASAPNESNSLDNDK